MNTSGSRVLLTRPRSVVGSFLNSSIWPNILSADSAASTAVPTGILLLTKIKKLLVALVAVAGIVTPLGLYEKILASDSSTPSAFHYISDPSPFGYGTPPRDNLRWSRRCGYYLPTQCPNSFSNITNHGNKTGMYASVEREDTHVPQYVIDAFQSGLSMFNDSVSSIFDIQPRHYTWSKVPKTPDSNSPDNGNPYPISHFRQISSLSLERKVTLVEGLVVDAENGGVGFRNHSAPPVKDFGSEWSEDILFIEPETQCADTNLTLDFMLPKYNSTTSEIANLVLTDRGGFVNHAHKGPKPTVTDPQNDPDLYARAHTAAWYNNAMTMVYMNVSNMRNLSDPNSKAYEYINSKVGKRFPLIDPKSSNFALSAPAGISPYALQSTTEFGKYLPDLGSAIFSNFSKRSNTTGKLYPNPFHVSKDDFTSIRKYICVR